MLSYNVDAFRESLKTKDRENIIQIAVDNFIKRSDLENRIKETERSSHEMFLEFEAMKARLEGAENEIAALRKQNMHLTGVYTAQAQEMYGRSSEKIKEVRAEAEECSEYTDPLSEDAPEEEANDPGKKKKDKKSTVIKFPGKHSTGERKLDLSKLPHSEHYEYDIDQLNEKYGEGNWRFCYWERSESAELVKQYTYCKVTYTPVVSVGLEHTLSRIPFEGRIISKSLASSSLLSLIFCDYGNMHVPFYRMEHDHDRFGLTISRQDMTNWLMNVSENLFKPVVDYLKECLKSKPYQQCDETPYTVIMERTHVTNYIWVHRTSELADTETIIIYCFEPSRSADHLLEFYAGLTTHIYLTSDAYGAYDTLENAFPGLVTVCGCFMHARRRPVDSIRIVGKGLSDAEISDLPEMKAINIISEMYKKENKLAGLSSKDRYEQRQSSVKQPVDDFFDYMNSLDENDPQYSDKFRDAIKYAKNQEQQLRMFLEDGSIPIDNGACERNIKSVAAHRKNSLFSFSTKGADATMNLISLIETAKANNAVPYYYLKYVMEKMALAVHYNHPYDIKDMVPWSEAYRSYELEQRLSFSSPGIPPGNEKPRTPRKRDMSNKAS